MKRLSLILLLSIWPVAVSTDAIAQLPPDTPCYWIDSAGQFHDLVFLCGNSVSPQPVTIQGAFLVVTDKRWQGDTLVVTVENQGNAPSFVSSVEWEIYRGRTDERLERGAGLTEPSVLQPGEEGTMQIDLGYSRTYENAERIEAVATWQ